MVKSRKLMRLCALFLAVITVVCTVATDMTFAAKKKKVTITTKELNAYMSKSGLVGSSTMIRIQRYFKKKPKDFLGHPKFIVRKGYSLITDRSLNRTYALRYKGKRMHARDIIAKMKLKRVFIMMGTNDIKRGVNISYKRYRDYILGIRKKSPKTTIFIISTTPIHTATKKNPISNSKIRSFNKKVKAFINTQRNMYYIDVYTGLSDKNGRLPKKWVSGEGFAHTNTAGSAVWTKIVIKYMKQFLLNEKIGVGNDQGKNFYKKALKDKKIARFDKDANKLYFNTGATVKGVCVYKGKLWFMDKETGKYRKKLTKKIRKLAKEGKPLKPLLKKIGKPKSRKYQPSCYLGPEKPYKDGILTYKHFQLMTLKDKNGYETVQDFDSVY